MNVAKPAQLAVGVVGLGRMGGGLALQALEKHVRVVGFTQGGARSELIDAGLVQADSPQSLARMLEAPRVIVLYIPAGAVVDTAIDELSVALEPGDVVVDGGNSYWGDSIRRAERLRERGVFFVDLGTSGGVTGARHGACFMAGGDRRGVAQIEPLLSLLAVPGGYVYAGPSGMGHFTKLVHNGIEFGMLQAIAEGVALLEAQGLPVEEILRCYRFGSVIRSWLMDLMEEEYRARGGLESVPSYVDDTGEVNWLIADALELDVPVPVIAQAVMQLIQSRDAAARSARAIALMRHGFGEHALGRAPAAAHERRTGRVGDLVRGDGDTG